MIRRYRTRTSWSSNIHFVTMSLPLRHGISTYWQCRHIDFLNTRRGWDSAEIYRNMQHKYASQFHSPHSRKLQQLSEKLRIGWVFVVSCCVYCRWIYILGPTARSLQKSLLELISGRFMFCFWPLVQWAFFSEFRVSTKILLDQDRSSFVSNFTDASTMWFPLALNFQYNYWTLRFYLLLVLIY